MNRETLDISLAKRRDKEKDKSAQKKIDEVKRYRGLAGVAIISAILGGTAGMMCRAEVPMDGPESPKIHLIHKIKYEIFDLFRGNGKEEDFKPKEEYIPQKDKGDSGIRIKLKPQQELDCDAHREDCLIS
jgi:hypothetical protein